MPSAQRYSTDSSQTFEPLPQYLTLQEFAAVLRVSLDTARRWVKAGRVPAVRLPGTNGKYLVPRDAVQSLLAVTGVR